MARKFIYSLAAAVLLLSWSSAGATEPRNLRPSEILMLLDDTVDGELFAKPRAFPDALAMINLHIARRGVTLPFRVNVNAFKEENPEMADFKEALVSAPDRGPRPKVWRVLQDFVDGLPGRNGAFVVRPGFVEITTNERALFSYAEPVILQARNRPLGLVLNDLFEQTGVGISVDAKVSRQLREPVSVTIPQPMPLNEALSAVLSTQKLGYCTIGRISKVVFVTTPENARRTWFEREYMQQYLLDPHSALLGSARKAPVFDLAQK